MELNMEPSKWFPPQSILHQGSQSNFVNVNQSGTLSLSLSLWLKTIHCVPIAIQIKPNPTSMLGPTLITSQYPFKPSVIPFFSLAFSWLELLCFHLPGSICSPFHKAGSFSSSLWGTLSNSTPDRGLPWPPHLTFNYLLHSRSRYSFIVHVSLLMCFGFVCFVLLSTLLYTGAIKAVTSFELFHST